MVTPSAAARGLRLPVSFACWDYDRTSALASGAVTPVGVDLHYLSIPAEETFFRMVRFGEFDAAEMSLSTYAATLESDQPPFVAIPYFPSRAFRHSSALVPAGSSAQSPRDLAGGRIGTPEFQIIAGVWMRGIFEQFHALPVSSPTYVTGGLERPGRTEKLKITPADGIKLVELDPSATLIDALLAGELDALYTAQTPQELVTSGRVRPLFNDSRAVEEQYFRETGIFPIMHVVVIRRELYDRHPWVARSLYDALLASHRLVMPNLHNTTALKYTLPWLTHEVARTRRLMGKDYWTSGLTANQQTLQTFLDYARAQGIVKRSFAPAELFAAETVEDVIL